MNKGDIVLIPFPFTDLSGIKNRPALILVDGESDLTVSFITTQLKWQEDFDVKIEPTQTNGFKKTSLIRLSKLATIDKDLVIGKLGDLSQDELTNVDKNLVKIYDQLFNTFAYQQFSTRIMEWRFLNASIANTNVGHRTKAMPHGNGKSKNQSCP